MQTTHNHIETKIKKSSKGKIFFAEYFLKFGSTENIRQVLRRLEEQGVLVRLAHGIYLVPKKDELLGTVYPSIEEIAKEIAKRDKARIAPIRKSIIKFKKTAPRNLAVKNELLQLIIQAYKITGEKNISEDFEEKLTVYIKKIDEKIVKSQLKYAPVWIQKRIKNRYLS